jgi:multiple antibiotic resistance protein
MLDYTEYTKFLVGLIAIVNPLGAVPIFIALTGDTSNKDRRNIAKLVVLSVFIILFVSLFFGHALLRFFGITIDSFRVAGGILILLMAISMLQAKLSAAVHTQEEAQESMTKESIAVVPLSMPLLAGPGAISTVILFSHKGSGIGHYFLAGLDIFILSIILFVVFQFIPWISRHISQTGINIFTRIMGLILAAIAIEFIANGLKGLFPSLM